MGPARGPAAELLLPAGRQRRGAWAGWPGAGHRRLQEARAGLAGHPCLMSQPQGGASLLWARLGGSGGPASAGSLLGHHLTLGANSWAA